MRRLLLCSISVLAIAFSGWPALGSAASDPTAAALERFDQIKFGMFIHWGLYAIPAGEWKGRYYRGIGEWIMFRAKIPVKEYEQLAAKFNPAKFNGDEWAKLAQEAGMRYMVITSKHHDGFAMFASKASRYNMVDATPYGRDPMKELAAACARRNIAFGFYYSQDQDWHEPHARGNTWDFPSDRQPEIYLREKVFPQVKELLTNYGPLALIWFDTPGLLSEAQVTELRNLVKSLQPGCLINSRIGHNRGDYFQTGDNAIPVQVFPKSKWEVPATLNDTWGYKEKDQNWKDPADLIAKLADIVSKGGNYLLNVGPTAEGVIPEPSQRVLRTIGKWLVVNGESVYGTSHSPFHYRDITWRCTVKPGKLYVHILNWPGRQLKISGLESRVQRAYFLANRRAVRFRQTAAAVRLDLPEQPVDPYNTVVVLELADQQPRVAAEYRYDRLPDRLDLYAWSARLRGEEIRYDRATLSATNFLHAEAERNELWWYPYGALNGVYQVEVTYACQDKAAGSPFRIAVHRGNQAPQLLRGRIEPTGGKFVTRALEGAIRIEPRDQYISFSLPEDDTSASLRLRKITLIRRSG